MIKWITLFQSSMRSELVNLMIKADQRIIKELLMQAQLKENRGYADNGIDAFKAEVIKYMEKVYGVNDLKMDEVLHNMGSKDNLRQFS